MAIFDEDDVDFWLRVDNKNKERDFRFNITVNNEDYRFMVDSYSKYDLQTLESNGRHFRFVRETSDAGKELLNELATKYSISPKSRRAKGAGMQWQVNCTLIFLVRKNSVVIQSSLFIGPSSDQQLVTFGHVNRINDIRLPKGF